jgi:histidinol-phosphate phosphatase family protein
MKIAHFTDLHFRSATPGTASSGLRRSRDVFPLFEKALAQAKEASVDLVVLTGDIVDVPMFLINGIPKGFAMPEVEPWIESVRADYEKIRQLMESCGIAYRILPGNHDAEGIFAEVFGPLIPDQIHNGFRVVEFVDFEHEGNVPRRFVPARDCFDQVLSDLDATPQIHLQHYLLIPPGDGAYPFAYAEHEFLREKIACSGKVILSLSGHYHAGTPLLCQDGTFYAVTPGFCDAPHRWRIYEVNGDRVSMEEQVALMQPALPAPVVFLDRDGVINDRASYTAGPEAMRLIPGSARAIKRLNEHKIRVVVVTSQSAIGAGYVPEAVVGAVNERMSDLLAREGAYLDAIYYTVGAGEQSVLPQGRTQPTAKSGLILRAAKELAIDLSTAWIVGDRLSDIEAGTAAGIRGMLVLTGMGKEQPVAPDLPVAADLEGAIDQILSR